jgi:hypothetical protein
MRWGAVWALAVALVVTARTRVDLIDEVLRVRPGGVRGVSVPLPVRTARLECEFQVLRGGSGVRLVLLGVDDARRFEAGHSHQVLVATSYEKAGRLAYTIPEPGEYRLVVDNRLEGRGPADVHLRASLVFNDGPTPVPRQLPPARRWLVVILSLGFFAAVAVFAGRRLLRAAAGPPADPPPAY